MLALVVLVARTARPSTLTIACSSVWVHITHCRDMDACRGVFLSGLPMPIKINTTRQDQTIHRTRISAVDLQALVTRTVAEQLGIDVSAVGVRTRAWHSSRDTSTGTEHEMEVELIVDHTKQPTSAVS